MRKIIGQSIFEYSFPTVIIGMIVGVAAFNFLTDGKIINFIAASVDMSSKTATEAVVTPYDNMHRFKPGEMGGSQLDPKFQCGVDNCSVDMGDYVINNIPLDFQDFIEKNSLSEGTKKLSDLLYLLEQTATVDSATKNLLLDLYDKSQNLAETQQALETKTKQLIETSYTGVMDSDFEALTQQLDSGQDKIAFLQALTDINTAMSALTDQDDINTLALINLISAELLALNDSLFQQASLTVDTGMIDYNNPDFQALTSPPYSFHNPVMDLDTGIVCNSGDGSEPGITCP